MPDDKRRFNLSLDMNIEIQRRVWDMVFAIPRGQKTETVCRMLLEHRSQSELLEAIRQAVREELETYGGFNVKTTNTRQPEIAGAVRNDILGFLRDLQEEDG